jgi:cytochrome P460
MLKGGVMLPRKSSAVLMASVLTVVGFCAAQAGGDKLHFPESYPESVKWLVIDKPQFKRIHEYYVTPEALDAARKNQPMPDGTVFVGVQYQVQRDAQGNPILGPDGHFVKANVSGYIVMEKHAGWGSEYPKQLRNGEWEYQIFKEDKTPNTKVKLSVCFECHKPFASQDYVQAYEKLKSAGR